MEQMLPQPQLILKWILTLPGVLTFTNCGQTGTSGPSQSDCDGTYSGTTLEGLMTMNGDYQSFEVPSDGTYEIEVAGARGGFVLLWSRKWIHSSV